ncbi:hypothetical protein CEXT_662121 [Caerostris extrusa]|uniref:Uncharacterized protein n=1 Tax=Caerostris extrusa TaxID=172846 RepID=A0AAV4WN82_CAEEX|nr:hypothetical protein CEXT_662121 [Caerostris extrusa]
MAVCPFRSKFVNDLSLYYGEEYTFQRNYEINQQFDAWRSSVLDILRQHRMRPHVAVPDSMKEWTVSLCSSNNVVEEWLDEAVVITDDPNDTLGLYDIAAQFIQRNPKVKFNRCEIIASIRNWVDKNKLQIVDRFQKRMDGKKFF